MNRKRVLLTITVLSLISAALFARGASDEAGFITPMTILYPKSVSSVPLLAVLEDYPNDYSGAFFTDHPQALAQLVTGEVDLLTTGFTVGYNRYYAAGDLVHLLTPVWSASALMTAEPLNSLADLAGGIVYSPFEGSPIDIYLNAIIDEADLEGDLAIAYAPFPQSAALLAQKQIAASVLVEPIASKLEVQGAAYRYENLSDGWARVSGGEARSPQVSLFATADTVQADSEALALLTQRYTQAVQDVIDNPATYASRFAETLGFPAPIIQRALENTLFEVPSHQETRRIITDYAGIMGLAPPSDDFYGN